MNAKEVDIDNDDRVDPASDGLLGCGGENAAELKEAAATGVAPRPRLVLGVGVGLEGPVENDRV